MQDKKLSINISKNEWLDIGEKTGWIKTAQSDYWRYFRKATDIIGYTWGADTHSPKETLEAIKNKILKVTDPNAKLDEHGIPESGVEDGEGNEIHPIFASDENSSEYESEFEARESGENDEDSEFNYLIDGHEDDLRMNELKRAAESMAEQMDESSDVHAALYWLLSDYHGGQSSPEYSALSSSPFSPGRLSSGPTGEEKFIYNQLKPILAKYYKKKS